MTSEITFDRYTDRARRAVVLADQAAAGMLHGTVDTGHLLLGLISEGGGVAFTALDALGVTADAAAEAVRQRHPCGDTHPTAHRPFTPQLKKALELALREGLQLGDNFIATEHLLLGLIREGSDTGALALADCGAPDPEFPATVRAKVLESLRGYEDAGKRAAVPPAGTRARGLAERHAFAWEILGRWRTFLGHIEDMGDDERLFMLGAMAGSLENLLRDAGVPEPLEDGRS